jgi:DNA (cytosine-5)-methyltransferase 1
LLFKLLILESQTIDIFEYQQQTRALEQYMQAISLFSGAGGMDIGFSRAGYETVWANDLDPVACETFRANGLGDIECGDLKLLLPHLKQFRGIDIVFGGPPCQGFSVAGKMDADDERNSLIYSFITAVDYVRPKVFVMENVKALAKLARWEHLRNDVIKQFSDLGYSVSLTVLNATDFGVPQKRERMFLIGFLKSAASSRLLNTALSRQNC